MSFLAELRRRRVIGVLIAYVVVGFAVIEGVDIVAPGLQLPDWSVTLVTILVIAGLPITAVVAWAFQVTPEGVRRGSEAIRRWFGEMLDSFTIEGFESFPEEVVVAGAWAFRRGTFDWRLRARDSGELLEPSSKFLQIWQRLEDDAWRVARGIWNHNEAD